jgi:hypothetical protein
LLSDDDEGEMKELKEDKKLDEMEIKKEENIETKK